MAIALAKPNPGLVAKEIDKRMERALSVLENANKGKEAEKTGVSARTLARINTR